MKQLSLSELRAMTDREGLVLQGCGGDLNEWVGGINQMLTEAGILKNGSTFTEVSVFEHDGCTNLLFPFVGVELDVGKLAMWRLSTHAQFGGTWLSDYVPNHLGGFVQVKPDCPLIGQDGNVLNLMGVASRTLKDNGLAEQAKEMRDRITACGSYDEALGIMGEYVNITSVDDAPEMGQDFEMRQSF